MATTQLDAYRALQKAADRMGANGYAAQHAAHIKAGRSPRTFRFVPTAAHRRVIDASTDVLAGRISVEIAMSVLHEYDVLQERF